MATKIEDAYITMKTGAQALIAEWAQKIPAEKLAEVEAAVSAGSRIRMQLDGGMHGEVFNVSAWLAGKEDEEVFLLFSFAPGESLKGMR